MKLLQKIAWPVFALVAALALWITFVGSPELLSSISAPLAYRNMPADLEIASELPERVHLEIRGPSARLRSVAGASMTVVVDLADVKHPGEYTFTIERREVDLPAGIELARAIPAQLHMRFERRLQAQVPVKPRFLGPPNGYRAAQVEVHPAALVVTGAESRVRHIALVETDAIELGRAAGKSQFRVRAYLEDPRLRFVSPPEVQVSVTLEKTR
jgi:YbbR domain-containing protein